MKTYVAKQADIEHNWYIVDAKDQVLGRLSVEIAKILRGKNKPTFTPHLDCGDNVIVINAEKIRLTGNKEEGKKYYSHSGYMGSLKSKTAAKLREEKPTALLYRSVKGMIPRNKLRDKIMDKLKLYVGEKHPHIAQQPKELKF
ncbi:50S ribosomal protein L13 [Candidatus Peregrinibacteria bacterium]|jgi:large subunit ribosomal protein L13|nr:50S ribosomal protein L13 [Candidatus Peregrinibacteria bacterium]